MTKKTGTVYLVGAGPYDPGLISVKGRDLIRRADCLVYDYLANPALLREARPGTEVIYVGKIANQHTKEQDEINAIIARAARRYPLVVRLKGGDPYIYGRGGEEAEYLVKRGIAVEVVPGISSFYSALAYAGIPVTHRECAASFAVITGHRQAGMRQDALVIPKADTLVFLMGVGNIAAIVSQVRQAGYAATTPVALVRWGTSPHQETLTGTLKDIVGKVAKKKLGPPAIIVIGKVVRMRPLLAFHERKPLFGQRVVVTRTRTQSSEVVRELQELGAAVVELPTIEIQSLDTPRIQAEIARLDRYDYIIFTSPNGVETFFAQVYKKGDARSFRNAKLVAIGPATAEALRTYGRLRADIVPRKYQAEYILECFPRNLAGKRILIPRARDAREVLPAELKKRGAAVTVLPVYRTVVPKNRAELKKLDAGAEIITFTSSSTVHNFIRMMGTRQAMPFLKKTKKACIGPVTAATLREYGLRADLVAKNYTINGLTAAIVKKWGKRQ